MNQYCRFNNSQQAKIIQKNRTNQQSIFLAESTQSTYEQILKPCKAQQSNELQQVRRIAKDGSIPNHIKVMLIQSKLKSLELFQQNLQRIESMESQSKEKNQKIYQKGDRERDRDAFNVLQNLSTASFATISQSSIFDDYSISNCNYENCESFQTYEQVEKYIQEIQGRILQKRVQKFEINQQLETIQDDIFQIEKVLFTKMQYDQHLTFRISSLRKEIQKVQNSKPCVKVQPKFQLKAQVKAQFKVQFKVQSNQTEHNRKQTQLNHHIKCGTLPSFGQLPMFKFSKPDPSFIRFEGQQNQQNNLNQSNKNAKTLINTNEKGVGMQQDFQNTDLNVSAVLSGFFKSWWSN